MFRCLPLVSEKWYEEKLCILKTIKNLRRILEYFNSFLIYLGKSEKCNLRKKLKEKRSASNLIQYVKNSTKTKIGEVKLRVQSRITA